MYDYTTPVLKSELAYRTDRMQGRRRAGRPVRGRTRTTRVRRGTEETRH